MADNDTRKDEFIFTINCDGLRSKSYANTTFLIHAACGDDFLAEYGTNNGGRITRRQSWRINFLS
jgi:hypothetical protein